MRSTQRSRNNLTSVKEYFSTHQRFHSAFANSSEQFFRSQVNKHSNPKFIEIIAKLRDPSLNAEYMEKAVIKPDVQRYGKKNKLD